MRRCLLLVLVASAGCSTRPVDPCAGVECGAGHCVVDTGAAACLCDRGWRADGLTCVTVDVCEGLSCDGVGVPGSVCTEHDGRAACVCPEGMLAHEGSCIPRTPCLPNPCSQPHRTTCALVGGGASCICDPGYTPEGIGCGTTPVWTCSAMHVGIDHDTAEPDECPALAPTLVASEVVDRNLVPQGDHDWFQIVTTAGFITYFEASSVQGDLPLLIEAFDETGTVLLAADTRGEPNAGVGFVSKDGRPSLVRVRAVSATGTGAYRVGYRNLGRDDFTDDPDEALSLSAGANFEGALQFPGDLDSQWIDIPGGQAVRLEFTSMNGVLDVRRSDGLVRTMQDAQVLDLTSPSALRLLLTVRARSFGLGGPYALHTAVLGRDDHSSEPLFATAINTDGVHVAGELENAEDLDTFAMQQRVGRIYRARWQAFTGTSLPSVTVIDAGGAVLAKSQNGQVTVSWKADGDGRVVLVVGDSRITTMPGRYAIAVDDLGPDDHADSAQGAMTLAIGIPVSGRIDLGSDLDAFVITLPVGHLLRVALTTPITPPPLAISITSPSGAMVAGQLGTGLVVSEAGPHLVIVRAPVAALTPYTLVAFDDGADDFGNTVATASPMPLNANFQGDTQFVGDDDVLTFPVQMNHVYRLTCVHASVSSACTVLNPSGVAVFGPTLQGDATFFGAVTGTYALRISSPFVGEWTVRVDELGPDDHPGGPGGAASLQSGIPVTGRLDFNGDRDVLRVDATEHRIYELTLTGPGSLQVLNASGGVVREITTGSLRFANDVTGPAYVAVFSRSVLVSNWSLSITALGLDDFGETAVGATPVVGGVSVPGSIDFTGDVDTFRVPVQQGHQFEARCAPVVCFVRVLTPAGVLIAPEPSAPGPSVFFRPPVGITEVLVEVRSTQIGTYDFVSLEIGVDDVGNLPGDAEALTLGSAFVTRSLEIPGDVDVFSITTNAGDIVALNCEVLTLQDCEFAFRTPTNTLITGAISGFRATTSGVYTVAISNSSSRTGTYRVKVALTTDDHGNTPALATPLVAGQPQPGRIDYAGDSDVFSLTLSVGQHAIIETDATCLLRARSPINSQIVASGFGFVDFDVEVDGVHTFALSNCTTPYTITVTY